MLVAMPQASQHREIAQEVVPVGERWALPAEWKSRDGVETGRLEKGIDAVDEGRRRRERDERRHMRAERLGEPDRVVGAGAADVNVLAKDRELLGQVAITLVDLIEAITRTNPPLRPAVEGMRAAAADGDMVARALTDAALAEADQIGSNAIDECPRQGADLDHAFGNFKLDLTKAAIVVHAAEKIRRSARQIKIAHGNQLQLKLDPQGQWLALS
jgi:hypothetical protein